MSNYITKSRDNCIAWRSMMRRLSQHVQQKDGRAFPIDYYDTSIIFRHVAHPDSDLVSSAFVSILRRLRKIERDQFVVPYYLWKANLAPQLELLEMTTLQSEMRHCQIPGFHRHGIAQVAVTDKRGQNDHVQHEQHRRKRRHRRGRGERMTALGPRDAAEVEAAEHGGATSRTDHTDL